MRQALMLVLVLSGVLCFVAGDVLWLMRRRQQQAMDLRATGSLVAIGVLLVLAAIGLRLA